MQKIIIRTDGGTSIGMGHVVRCIALANMLKNNFTITFAIQSPSESILKSIYTVTAAIIHLPQTNDYTADTSHFTQFLNADDIVVLDGYHFKTDYQKAIKEKGCKLVVIDDLHNWHHVADVIINHAEGINESMYSAEKYTQFYFGLKYALLRSAFLKPTPAKTIHAVKKVFISMGAADINNLTQKFTTAVLEIKGVEEIHLMLGTINPNLTTIERLIQNNEHRKIVTHFDISADELALLLKECDVSICPASSISLEACAIGVGLISGYTAENQKGNLAGMEKQKALINFGDMNVLGVSEIKSKLVEVFSRPFQLNELIKNQKKMIDGKSNERLLKLFKNI